MWSTIAYINMDWCRSEYWILIKKKSQHQTPELLISHCRANVCMIPQGTVLAWAVATVAPSQVRYEVPHCWHVWNASAMTRPWTDRRVRELPQSLERAKTANRSNCFNSSWQKALNAVWKGNVLLHFQTASLRFHSSPASSNILEHDLSVWGEPLL